MGPTITNNKAEKKAPKFEVSFLKKSLKTSENKSVPISKKNLKVVKKKKINPRAIESTMTIRGRAYQMEKSYNVVNAIKNLETPSSLKPSLGAPVLAYGVYDGATKIGNYP